MVTQLISGITYGIQAVTLPRSPATIPVALPAPSAKTRLYLEFACQNELIGRIVLKLVDTGRLGREFEFLMSGRLGYGYKGSRVYACCRNEWCLMGDLIYEAPRPPAPPLQDWDCRGVTVSQPPDPESPEAEADDGVFVPRKLYRGYRGLTECEKSALSDTVGSVVLVGSDLDMSTGAWTLGPQFKVCLGDSLIASGRVVAQVEEGMDVAVRLSQMSLKGDFAPSERITITDCGTC
ncbi:uncharacterized protein LOC122246763 [Penaeus japonicus]|uniref:uncharacterized protein LOC122246763 n=1 Tax=Penaeus japonicus TaxID=27405 RepID=UPI001C717657|nr:uncharacterized protein LOC122246763 [Penaeus japonicus]XP_042861454.1 uncharacterized protein LOC122246763 [Penaeus japonicus]XP_042861455.1 uncharacterized protein LOC122246763 [Penaeus japonicus]